MRYIATFYSHFGAIRFKNEAHSSVTSIELMPVPRNLSSSCGTCARFEAPDDYTINAMKVVKSNRSFVKRTTVLNRFTVRHKG